MKILFFDDDRDRHKIFHRNFIGTNIVHTYDVDHTIKALQTHELDVWFLDHDIYFKSLNGTDLVNWIVANQHLIKSTPKYVFIHSLNHPAAESMCSKLVGLHYPVVIYPFAWVKLQYDKELGIVPIKNPNIWEGDNQRSNT